MARRRRKNPSGTVAGAGLLVGLLGVGLLVYAMSPGLPDGVTVSESATLSPRAVRFLQKLRAAVPASIPIHVTSGGRTYEEQATLMMRKYTQYPDEFKRIYNVAATRLLKLPWDYNAWLAEVKKLYAEGILRSDGHIGGGAVDLRTSNLPVGGLQTIVAAASSLGAKPLVEADHIHIDIKDAA